MKLYNVSALWLDEEDTIQCTTYPKIKSETAESAMSEVKISPEYFDDKNKFSSLVALKTQEVK